MHTQPLVKATFHFSYTLFGSYCTHFTYIGLCTSRAHPDMIVFSLLTSSLAVPTSTRPNVYTLQLGDYTILKIDLEVILVILKSVRGDTYPKENSVTFPTLPNCICATVRAKRS